MTDGGAPRPGWYPDPWFAGQHRYWTGGAWTGDVFEDGPTVTPRPEGQRPPVPPPTLRSAGSVPPPTFASGAATASVLDAPVETLGDDDREWRPRRRPTGWQINALALVIGLVLGFVVIEQLAVHRHPSAAAGSDAQSVLGGLVVRTQDVPSSVSVQPLDGGAQVSGQTTLDLCNGTFPSESLRQARLQVVASRSDGSTMLSTEAVAYGSGSDTAQAFRELESVVARCPNTPVVSPVGEPTVTTRFQAPPDRSWPATPGVQRHAYAFTTTDQQGDTTQQIAVYLRRGRVLEGLYFPSPGQGALSVDGRTTVAAVVQEFERRIAALPSSFVNH